MREGWHGSGAGKQQLLHRYRISATFCCGMVGGLAAVPQRLWIFCDFSSPHGSPHWVVASFVMCCSDASSRRRLRQRAGDHRTARSCGVAISFIPKSTNGPCCHWTRWHWDLRRQRHIKTMMPHVRHHGGVPGHVHGTGGGLIRDMLINEVAHGDATNIGTRCLQPLDAY